LVATTVMTSSFAGATVNHATKFKPVTVNIGENPATFTNQALYVLAQQQGFFKKYGIVANLVPVSASAAPEALASGAIDTISLAVSTAVTMRISGANVRVIGPQWETLPYDLVASVKTDIPVVGKGATWQRAIRAMVGKTIAYTGARSVGSGIFLDAYFKALHINPATAYNFVSLPTGDPTVAAFTAGTVNVAFVQPQTAVQLVKLGLGKIVMQVSKSGPPLARDSAFTGYFMMQPFLQKHPGIATRFVDAMSATVAWAKEPKNLGAVTLASLNALVVEPNSYDSASIEAILATLGPTQFTSAQVENLFTLLKQVGTIPATSTITPSEVFMPSSIIGTH
jgi:ABC-type nitrate/sulfonate/bicarbonate transport system substrate-binding protein